MDYVPPCAKPVIVVDGGYHAERQQQWDNAPREQALQQAGGIFLGSTHDYALTLP